MKFEFNWNFKTNKNVCNDSEISKIMTHQDLFFLSKWILRSQRTHDSLISVKQLDITTSNNQSKMIHEIQSQHIVGYSYKIQLCKQHEPSPASTFTDIILNNLKNYTLNDVVLVEKDTKSFQVWSKHPGVETIQHFRKQSVCEVQRQQRFYFWFDTTYCCKIMKQRNISR